LHDHPPDPRRPIGRRALCQVGGEVELSDGTSEERALLTRALAVEAEPEGNEPHMHGFHSYPARLHPKTAEELVRGLSLPGQTVLDPFFGSGTVPVEAVLLGRKASGVDANPLAVRLASLKVRGSSPAERSELVAQARSISELAEERRVTKRGPSRRYPPPLVASYEPHVFLELDGLVHHLGQLDAGWVRDGLMLVFSSLLVKLSRKRSDTSAAPTSRRLRAGFTIQLFARKAEELARRLEEFSISCPSPLPRADLRLGDARRLPFPDGHAAAIVTSPPYPGVYDYTEHHRLRFEWLGLSPQFMHDHEIGARRRALGTERSLALCSYEDELLAMLSECARVLAPTGAIALVMADSVIMNQPWYADDALRALAPRAGLRVTATGSQRRAHFHHPTARAFARRPRREHLLLLAPLAQKASPPDPSRRRRLVRT